MRARSPLRRRDRVVPDSVGLTPSLVGERFERGDHPVLHKEDEPPALGEAATMQPQQEHGSPVSSIALMVDNLPRLRVRGMASVSGLRPRALTLSRRRVRLLRLTGSLKTEGRRYPAPSRARALMMRGLAQALAMVTLLRLWNVIVGVAFDLYRLTYRSTREAQCWCGPSLTSCMGKGRQAPTDPTTTATKAAIRSVGSRGRSDLLLIVSETHSRPSRVMALAWSCAISSDIVVTVWDEARQELSVDRFR